MNIFFWNAISGQCGPALPDKLLIKMILEYCQLLWGAYYEVDPANSRRAVFRGPAPEEQDKASPIKVYKATHLKHPCSIWVRSSKDHFCWLLEDAVAMCAEYTRVYGGKVHACEPILHWMQDPAHQPTHFPTHGWTPPPIVVNDSRLPEEYRSSVETAYCWYIANCKGLDYRCTRTASIPPFLRGHAQLHIHHTGCHCAQEAGAGAGGITKAKTRVRLAAAKNRPCG